MRLGTRFREVDDGDVIASDLLYANAGDERRSHVTFPLEAAEELSVPQPVSGAASVRTTTVWPPPSTVS
jgi:hypothetical protein